MLGLLVRLVGGHDSLAAGQVDVHTTGVLLGGVLETQFAANLLHARLDLLDMACGVVTLADDANGGVSWGLSDGICGG